jgi:hypothetical protein
MKPLIPVLMAVSITVAIIVVMFVAIPYQEGQEQKKFAQEGLDELNKCMQIQQQLELNPFIDQTQNQMAVKQYEDCVENVWQNYATDDELEKRDNMVNEHEESLQKVIQQCREEYIGQLHEMESCIENSKDMMNSLWLYKTSPEGIEQANEYDENEKLEEEAYQKRLEEYEKQNNP